MASGYKELWLPVFFSLHLEGVLQPVQQLVGELAHILLLSKAHAKWPITGLPLGHRGHRVKLQDLTAPTSKKAQSVKSMLCLSSADIHWALDQRWLVLVHWLLSFKGNLHTTRPLSQTLMPAGNSGQCLSNLTRTQSSDMSDENRGRKAGLS